MLFKRVCGFREGEMFGWYFVRHMSAVSRLCEADDSGSELLIPICRKLTTWAFTYI